MFRYLLTLFAISVTGCKEGTPEKMYSPKDLPSDVADIDPWIAKLLSRDVSHVQQILNERLASDDSALAPIVRRVSEYIPCQIAYSSGVGHVRCVRQYTDKETGRVGYDAVYIAQPLATETLNSKVIFFDNKVRPLLNAFLSRFAGSGEEMQGTAGHFTFSVWPKASEYGSRDENSFDDWKHARLFYAATNGDSVFIKPDGSTAWHVLETDEFIPIAGTFDKFIDIYADFRGSHDVFDSWAYREYRENRTKR